MTQNRHILRLESAPLHTEAPKWAAHAPEQAAAVYQRGSHVVGFTEITKAVAPELTSLAEHYGYTFIHGEGDTALAIQSHLKVIKAEPFVHVAGLRGYSSVRFTFYRNDVTVFNQHWGTDHPSHQATRQAQTKALIAAMRKASRGARLAFYMGDANPNKPLSHPDGFPRAELDAAGMPLVYEDLDKWPAHIGVNVMGHARKDTRVQVVHIDQHYPLGSDHYPVRALYAIHNARVSSQPRDPGPIT